MKCPFCRADNDKVIDSRSSHDGMAIRRRRECVACSRRFTTYERPEETTIKVVKKDGSRVPFDREKIKRGLERACWKRPISSRQIEATTTDIENEVYAQYESEVQSRQLGELVMRYLRRSRRCRLRPLRQRLSPIQRRLRLLRRAQTHARRSPPPAAIDASSPEKTSAVLVTSRSHQPPAPPGVYAADRTWTPPAPLLKMRDSNN